MNSQNRRNTVIGAIFILWGGWWMARELGVERWFDWIKWGEVWPVILIFTGLSIFNWKGIKGIVFGGLVTLATVGLVLWSVLR